MRRLAALFLVALLALLAGPRQPALAEGGLLRFEPTPKYVVPGAPSFTVDVWVENLETADPDCGWDPPGPCGLGAYKIEVSFDETVIQWISTANGPFLNSTGRPLWDCVVTPGHDPDNGVVGYQCTTTNYPPGELGPPGPTGSGHLATIEFAPLVADGTTALVFETAVLAEPDGTPIAGVTTQPGSVIIAPHADLDIDKTAPPTVSAPGNIPYDVQVANLGPSTAEGVTVVDTLSSDVGFVSADPRCGYNPSPAHNVTCDLGNIPASANDSVDITVSVAASKAGRTINNVATVSSTTLEPDESNNSAQASTVVDLANVDIVKTGPEQVDLGATDQYEIVVTSTGPSGAGNVAVNDNLPTGVEYVGYSSTVGSCSYSTSPVPHVWCWLGDLAVSESETITITVTFPETATYVCNQAQADWDQLPPGLSESDPACTSVGNPDSDGDGCTDAHENGSDPVQGGQRDPSNPWDFFDVPVPVIHDGGTLDDRDRAITILADVLAVLEYTGTTEGGPPNGLGIAYDEDIDGDTVIDGRAYDRSPGSEAEPPHQWSDAPDGAISILVDVLLVLAQTGHSCQAPPPLP